MVDLSNSKMILHASRTWVKEKLWIFFNNTPDFLCTFSRSSMQIMRSSYSDMLGTFLSDFIVLFVIIFSMLLCIDIYLASNELSGILAEDNLTYLKTGNNLVLAID